MYICLPELGRFIDIWKPSIVSQSQTLTQKEIFPTQYAQTHPHFLCDNQAPQYFTIKRCIIIFRVPTYLVSKPDPRKIKKEGSCKSAGVEVYTAPAGTLPIGFWLAFWCASIRNANRTRAVFTFCFILESCKTKQVRLEHFCESSIVSCPHPFQEKGVWAQD